MPATLPKSKRRVLRFRLAALPKAQKAAAQELSPIFCRFGDRFDALETAQIVVAALEEELDRHPAPRSAMASALARGVLAREQFKHEEGGSISAEEARKLLGISKESVLKRYRNAMLLGWREARQDAVRFPVWQFAQDTEDGLLPGLGRVLNIMRESETLDDWGRILFFLNPRDSLSKKRPLDLLRNHELKPVLTAAHSTVE